MLDVMSRQQVIISFDETIIRAGTGRSYSWANRHDNVERHYTNEVNDLSLLVAVVSDGTIIFQFMTGNNNDTSV